MNLEFTPQMLSQMHLDRKTSTDMISTIFTVVITHFPAELLDRPFSWDKAKERAHQYYVQIAGDQYLLQRAYVLGIVSAMHEHPDAKSPFSVSFPYIEQFQKG